MDTKQATAFVLDLTGHSHRSLFIGILDFSLCVVSVSVLFCLRSCCSGSLELLVLSLELIGGLQVSVVRQMGVQE